MEGASTISIGTNATIDLKEKRKNEIESVFITLKGDKGEVVFGLIKPEKVKAILNNEQPLGDFLLEVYEQTPVV